MRIIVGCEASQAVTIELRKNGHEAYSCDIIDQSGGHPEWHIMQDVLPLLNGDCAFQTADGTEHRIDGKWDMIIAFPPCTYMSNAGACRMYPKAGQINEARLEKAMKAKEFFMQFYNADCQRIAIENPRPLNIVQLPKESQRIQPYEFGEPWSKLTYLWLKGLPPLMPTEVVKDYKPYVSCGTSRNKGKKGKAGMSRSGGAQKVRSRTFRGIAKAMAEQWAGRCEDGTEESRIWLRL